MTSLAKTNHPIATAAHWELTDNTPNRLEPRPTWDLSSIVSDLREVRLAWRHSYQRSKEFGGRELPSLIMLEQIIKTLLTVLYPMRFGPLDLHQDTEDYYVGLQLDTALHALLLQVKLALSYQHRLTTTSELKPDELEKQAIDIIQAFARALPRVRQTLDQDVLAAFHGDPAAKSVNEVLICYPGLKAMIFYRLAHELYVLKVSLIARVIAEIAHSETGIDIHPGARIGSGFFIDHGTGVVIGETATIGKNVRLYQAVTLGAKRFETNPDGTLLKDYVRHPTVEDEVVIYAGATILGNITIGRGSVIGGNVWLTHSVPANSYITQESLAKQAAT